MLRVVIADDHDLFREGLRQLLETVEDIAVVGEASNGHQACKLVMEHKPDVVLMDISMPEMDGIQATEYIVQRYPETHVVVLTMYTDDEYAIHAIRAGAKGYLLKESAPDELVKAIREVCRGGYYFSQALHGFMAQSLQNRVQSSFIQADSNPLTSKEREIVQLIAEGLANKQIARELKISVNTVHAHRNNISRKLDIHKQTDLVRYAIKEKIAKL